MAVLAKWRPRLCIDARDPPQAQNIIMESGVVRGSLSHYALLYSLFRCVEKGPKCYFRYVNVSKGNNNCLRGIKRIFILWIRARCHSILFGVPKKGAL